ncbi:hypothetical protein [Tenacibaculum agarivorans]|uniref:hypothetical protein n=1 Tax=Tenacibaculum agarivorans TaxID=1908389 RepID=UPI00117E4E23|nr:hypothetical protein [Tenacibaculum agarivorans]
MKGNLLEHVESNLITIKECYNKILKNKKGILDHSDYLEYLTYKNQEIFQKYLSENYRSFLTDQSIPNTHKYANSLTFVTRIENNDLKNYEAIENFNQLEIQKKIKNVGDSKLDYYASRVGFEGFLDAYQYQFNLQDKKETICEDNFGRESYLTFTIPPDLPQEKLDKIKLSLKEFGISEFKYFDKKKEINIGDISNQLSKDIEGEIELIEEEISKSLGLIIKKAKQLFPNEKVKVLLGKQSKNKNKKFPENYFKFLRRVYSNRSSSYISFQEEMIEKYGVTIDLIRAFDDLNRLNFEGAIKSLTSHVYKNTSNKEKVITLLIKLHINNHDFVKAKELNNVLLKNYKKNPSHKVLQLFLELKISESYPNQTKRSIWFFALETIKSALTKKSDNYIYWSVLGQIKQKLNTDSTHIYECFDNAIKNGSKNIDDYINLAYYHWIILDYKNVKQILELYIEKRIYKCNKHTFILKVLAYIAFKEEDYQKGFEYLNK